MTLVQSANQSTTEMVSILKTPEQNAKIVDNAEVLSILKEEQQSLTASTKFQPTAVSQKPRRQSNFQQSIDKLKCLCGQKSVTEVLKNKLIVGEIEKLLKEREHQLRAEYDRLLDKELHSERQRFELIIENEQMRTSYMLREAHRERQEKIRALERQLECKNIAALMYVMCTERSRGKLEKLELIEEYTIYIKALQELLIEGQTLILHLSRGYKTAARVDQEWREKMTKIIGEFMSFIYHFAGGPPENNQYYFDLTKLLKTEAPLEDDPLEDPCEEEEVEGEEASANFGEKDWWETLEGEDRPFIMFGDMADFKPPQRREVLKAVKAPKTAPKAWKRYQFNNLCIKGKCENANAIKDSVYLRNMSDMRRMETRDGVDSPEVLNSGPDFSKLSTAGRHQTSLSLDMQGASMGSILKLIYLSNISLEKYPALWEAWLTRRHSANVKRPFESFNLKWDGTPTAALALATSANTQPSEPTDKAALLGALDSMEILSTTRLRQSLADKNSDPSDTVPEGVKIPIGKRQISHFDDLLDEDVSLDTSESTSSSSTHVVVADQDDDDEEKDEVTIRRHLGLCGHTDSLQVVTTHMPEKDHKINYEKVCPTDVCQRLEVDSFMKSLPSYMRANPFTHFIQTYEAYESCTKEQLEILKERLEAMEALDTFDESELNSEHVLKEWETGIATQTSIQALDESCTCFGLSTSPVDSNFIFDLRDLVPVKQLMNSINKACLHDERIEFNRFQVVGQEEDPTEQAVPKKEFWGARARSICNILKQHPSLLDIFQANAQ